MAPKIGARARISTTPGPMRRPRWARRRPRPHHLPSPLPLAHTIADIHLYWAPPRVHPYHRTTPRHQYRLPSSARAVDGVSHGRPARGHRSRGRYCREWRCRSWRCGLFPRAGAAAGCVSRCRMFGCARLDPYSSPRRPLYHIILSASHCTVSSLVVANHVF